MMTRCADRSLLTEGAPPRAPRARRAAAFSTIAAGTGLSFDDYDAHTEITGIDISEPMIAREARARAKSGRYPFVKELW